MIITGPLAINIKTRHFEVGQLEAWWGSNWSNRIPLWINNSPFVQGRPDWRFLKMYTHGVQSKKLILSQKFRNLFLELKKYTATKGIKLHFVSAREAYNIIKAAELNSKSDPESYREFKVKSPLNTTRLILSSIN